MNRIQKSLLAIVLAGSLASSAYSSSESSVKTVAAGSLIALVSGYALYKAYRYIQHYSEEKIINDSVDAIVLTLMPSAKPSEKELREKAKLITMRKRVIQRLSEIKTLSKQHSLILNNQLSAAKLAFIAIDVVRTPNPYEKEYDRPSIVQQIIEKNLVESIVLKIKPDSECTAQELAKKVAQKKRSNTIATRAQQKLLHKASSHLINTIAFWLTA